MVDTIVRLMAEVVSASGVKLDEPMSKHTSFHVGGKADLLVEPNTVPQLIAVIRILQQTGLPYTLLGNGSNVLVGDKGIRGVVVQITSRMAEYKSEENTIEAAAGIHLAKLANVAFQNELSGLEFASGIPGSLGGAIYMNAGAYGGEMKNVIEEVIYLDEAGKVHRIPGSDCAFGYRTSRFAGSDDVILGCKLRLTEGKKEDIKALMDDYNGRRTAKQPLHQPSAGSTFKRPEGYFAGKLIEDAGLRGFRIGGAAVSEKHCGFVVNEDHATAADVCAVIRHVQETVEEKFGVRLETEVKFVGEF